jgi:acyl-CoA reductase-like NAD-dependent aldehyde dehydrogenase
VSREPLAAELDGQVAALRELIRAAHEANKDLRRTLAEVRRELTGALQDAGNAQTREYSVFLQGELDRYTEQVGGEMTRAREAIVHALTLMRLIPEWSEDGDILSMRVTWRAGLTPDSVPAQDGAGDG